IAGNNGPSSFPSRAVRAHNGKSILETTHFRGRQDPSIQAAHIAARGLRSTPNTAVGSPMMGRHRLVRADGLMRTRSDAALRPAKSQMGCALFSDTRVAPLLKPPRIKRYK